MTITTNIIGAGRLGKTIGRLLVLKTNATILGVCNRSQKSADEAVAFVGQGRACESIRELPATDLILISTADEQIRECVTELIDSPQLRSGTVVAHCGGAISSEILSPLRDKGCSIASMHPMHSFADPKVSVEHFAGTFCALEGDTPAVAMLEGLLTKIGALISHIDPSMKALYHAGGVMASNYLVTLFDKAVLCLESSGASHDAAKQIAFSLMNNSLQNLSEVGSARKALTGPIMRGEADVVAMHVDAMPNEIVSRMYKALGLATFDIAQVSQQNEERLKQVLDV